ncbi:conserved hypothetical protein [Ricinus communis]|uniref:TF-B3 domain-containing protein n=1 Tax=Ricinus communis TaxID=3988 RepID=B9SXG2_RICCO|nr:conserved hypothetical protein [Ricinus communis]
MSKRIFGKELTETDVGKRLAIPISSLKSLPGFEGKHFLDLKVKYKSMEEPLEFRCSIRKKGIHPKPVFDKGWLEFVHCNDIKVGNWVCFLQEGGHGDTAKFKIEVKRKIVLLGQVIWAHVP